MRSDLTGRIRLVWSLATVGLVTCLGEVSVAAAGHNHSTPQEIFDGMRSSFQPAKAKGVHARYQWDLSAPNGGEWWIDVNDGTYKMGTGKIPNPSVTFVATDKDWVAVSNHQLGGTW